MKVKTSITLSETLLTVIDRNRGQKNRSLFIETAVRFFIDQIFRADQNRNDLRIINQRSDYLNREAADVLDYQDNR